MASPQASDADVVTRVREALAHTPYASYTYSYPHKLAYRTLEPAVPLDEAWEGEDRSALFLYAHVPFCEQRCGFCNLFTLARAQTSTVDAYLDAFERQARVVRAALGDARFGASAIGGGTPTYLGARGLERLFAILERTFDLDLEALPCSIEVSPETATDDALAPIAARRIERVSMGVQSFVDDEASAIQRRQAHTDVERAIEAIRRAGPRVLNLDLMYGLPGQSEASFLASLDAALAHAPEELYLYPLYVRPLTGLGKRRPTLDEWDATRLALYRTGRDKLLAEGYLQVSMRMFRRPRATPTALYRCQSDGMLGLGCGARSYTGSLHYSSPYATGTLGVRSILARWIESDDQTFAEARWGVHLDAEERRRRYVILSILADEGLDLGAYETRFGTDARADLPELDALHREGAVTREGAFLRLTDFGRERSDAIGPLLGSARVRALASSAERG